MLKENGFISIILSLSIFLFLIFLIGTVQYVQSSQKKIALQSRLDICAVAFIQRRKQLLYSIQYSNKKLQHTRNIIYSLRGLSLLPIPGLNVYANMGEKAVLFLHRSIANWQSLLIAKSYLQDLKEAICEPNLYSKESVFCKIHPMSNQIFIREKDLQPDLYGNLNYQNNNLGSIHCVNKNLQTKIQIKTDFSQTQFMDEYEK